MQTAAVQLYIYTYTATDTMVMAWVGRTHPLYSPSHIHDLRFINLLAYYLRHPPGTHLHVV